MALTAVFPTNVSVLTVKTSKNIVTNVELVKTQSFICIFATIINILYKRCLRNRQAFQTTKLWYNNYGWLHGKRIKIIAEGCTRKYEICLNSTFGKRLPRIAGTFPMAIQK